MALREGDYELDGVFTGNIQPRKGPYTILESGDVTSRATFREQDVANVRGDSLFFGRDYVTPPDRNFVIHVFTDEPLALERLKALWRGDRVRGTPGRVSTLRWRLDGQDFLAYGRPRGYEEIPQKKFDPSYRILQTFWQYQDSYKYLDDPQQVTLGGYASIGGSGIILPKNLPWILGEAPSEQVGTFHVTALTETPFEVEIEGPSAGEATNLVVWGPGWRLDFGTLTLRPFSKLVVDTRAQTALLDGRSVAGNLSHNSTLSGRIRPGNNTFRFTCSDPTVTTRATIRWRESVPL